MGAEHCDQDGLRGQSPQLTQAGVRVLWLGQTWEFATWEIAHFGSCHLGKYHWEVDVWEVAIWEVAIWEVAIWEKSFGKVHNILTSTQIQVKLKSRLGFGMALD